jgi:hypothetical protein
MFSCMATRQSDGPGMAHLTVVPENFEPERTTDEPTAADEAETADE